MLRWNARIADVGLEQEKALSLLDGIYSTVMIRDILESYFFYEIKRFDIKGKAYLRTLGKYYIVDIGLRNYLLGFVIVIAAMPLRMSFILNYFAVVMM